MTINELNFEHGGREYTPADFEDQWDIELDIDNENYEAIKKHTTICEHVLRAKYSTVSIAKTNDGKFFLIWEETHPESVPMQEVYGSPQDGHDWTAEQYQEYREMDDALGADETLFVPITRREAYALIVLCWLPEEFHADAGL